MLCRNFTSLLATATATATATVTLALALALGANAAAAAGDATLLKRGALLVGIGGCVDCHTPLQMGAQGPQRDMSRGLSGHPEGVPLAPPPTLSASWNWAGSATTTAFVGPWGTTYASNLTPDRITGIGAWSAQDFIAALRNGRKHGDARPLLPPMPWQALAGLPERDLRAVYAYLMAQPAVVNRVPDYQPPPAAPAP